MLKRLKYFLLALLSSAAAGASTELWFFTVEGTTNYAYVVTFSYVLAALALFFFIKVITPNVRYHERLISAFKTRPIKFNHRITR